MRAGMVVVAVSVGCGAPRQPAPAPSPTPPPEPVAATVAEPVPQPADPCADTALRLEVTPPGAGESTATFAFRWEGQGSGEPSRVICLVRGDEVERVPRGERREVAIRADARALQRILVDGRAHLVAVPPGATITLGDHPCFFYELSGPNTDPWFAPAPIAYCAGKGKDCRPGYFHPSPPRPVEDELCGDTSVTIRRCVEEAELRLVTAPAQPVPAKPGLEDDVIPLSRLAGGAALRLEPRSCGFALLETGREVVALVVGAGERWSLAVDAAGRLSGELAPR